MNIDFITKFNERDEGVFKLVFYALYPKYLRAVKRRIGDHQESEDIVLRVFSGLWRGKAKFKEYRGIDAYVYLAARNACINYFKLRKISIELKDFDIHEEVNEEDDETMKLHLMYRLIDKLPYKYKRVLMFDLEGLNDLEIAKITNVKHETVSQQRWRAISMIKTLLNK